MAKPPDRKQLTAGQAVRATLASSVRRLFEHELAVLEGRKPEALHQARVAVRRLRSDLRSFRPLVDRHWSDPLRQELRWLGTEFGSVRDLDVFIQRLRDDASRAGIAKEAGVRAVLARIRAERASVRKNMLDALGSGRYRELHGRLASAARAPRLTLAAKMSAADALEPVVRASWKRLRNAVRALSPHPSARALHRIRILAKRCRYAAEAAWTAVGEPAKQFADAAAGLQDALGEVNDAAAACGRLARLRRQSATALASTALLMAEREALARARAAWPHAWGALAVKRLRAWF